jgi:hypothetical protein
MLCAREILKVLEILILKVFFYTGQFSTRFLHKYLIITIPPHKITITNPLPTILPFSTLLQCVLQFPNPARIQFHDRFRRRLPTCSGKSVNSPRIAPCKAKEFMGMKCKEAFQSIPFSLLCRTQVLSANVASPNGIPATNLARFPIRRPYNIRCVMGDFVSTVAQPRELT